MNEEEPCAYTLPCKPGMAWVQNLPDKSDTGFSRAPLTLNLRPSILARSFDNYAGALQPAMTVCRPAHHEMVRVTVLSVCRIASGDCRCTATKPGAAMGNPPALEVDLQWRGNSKPTAQFARQTDQPALRELSPPRHSQTPCWPFQVGSWYTSPSYVYIETL